jgi:Cof subfamily protein (haloacid dehalogenase superfamily)
MKKIIFIDIDGTLADEKGRVPNSAKEAIKRARERGHEVYLCTGRSKVQIIPSIIEIGFDGIISGAGALVERGNDVLFQKTITKEDLSTLLGYLKKNGAHYLLETNQKIYDSKKTVTQLKNLLRFTALEQQKAFAHILEVEEDSSLRGDVNKVLFLSSQKSISAMKYDLKETFQVIENSIKVMGKQGGEIANKGVHKAVGMQQILSKIGVAKEDTIAIGDSFNDLEMIAYAGVGIAMGNACLELKQIADDITNSIDEDGVWEAFSKYKLC